MSNSLWPHGLQHARPPCPSPTPGACSNSCLLSQWCHPTISSSVIPFSSCLQSFPASGSFQVSQFFSIRWPKYWSFSFSISSSHEYTGLISFRIDWLDLLEVQETFKSSPTQQFKSINSFVLSFLYSPTLTSIHDYWNCQINKLSGFYRFWEFGAYISIPEKNVLILEVLTSRNFKIVRPALNPG